MTKRLFLFGIGVWALCSSGLFFLHLESGWTDRLGEGSELGASRAEVERFLGGRKEYSLFYLYPGEGTSGVAFWDQAGPASAWLEGEIAASGFFEARSVKSLRTVNRVNFEGLGMSIEPFLDEEGGFAGEEEWLEAPFLEGNFVGRSGEALALVATWRDVAVDRLAAFAWQREMEGALADRFGLDLDILDDVRINAELDAMALRDSIVWPGLATLAIAACFYLLCGRKPWHVAGFFLLCGMTISATLGAMAWVGIPFSVIFIFIPILLVVAAGSDFPYLVLTNAGGDPGRLRRRLRTPLALAAGTTAIASASLFLSGIDQIRDFALAATLGLVLNTFFALCVLPPILGRWGVLRGASVIVPCGERGAVVSCPPRRRAWLLAGVPLVVGLIAIPAALSVPWSDDYIEDYFPPGHPVRESAERANGEFGSFNYLKVRVGPAMRLDRFEDLGRLRELQEAMGQLPGVARTFSILDVVAYVHGRWQEEAGPSMPASSEAYDYLRTHFLGDVVVRFEDDLIDPAFRTAAIDVFLDSADTRVHEEVVDGLTGLEEEWGVRLDPGGYQARWLHYKQHVVGLKLASVVTVVFLLWVVSCAYHAVARRSFAAGARIAFLIVLPVCLAVPVVLGAMGLLGVHLNIATATITTIALGVSVNFAVHLAHTVFGDGRKTAVRTTVRAITVDLFTSLCFLFLLGASVPAIRTNGVLIAGSVAVAFAWTLCFLPLYQRTASYEKHP